MLSFQFYIPSYPTEILSPTEATKFHHVKGVDKAAKLQLYQTYLFVTTEAHVHVFTA